MQELKRIILRFTKLKKKLVILSILGLIGIGTVTYAAEKFSTPNIEQSNVYLEEARNLSRKNDLSGAEKKLHKGGQYCP